MCVLCEGGGERVCVCEREGEKQRGGGVMSMMMGSSGSLMALDHMAPPAQLGTVAFDSGSDYHKYHYYMACHRYTAVTTC